MGVSMNLSKWLKRHGIVDYTIRLADTQELLQQNLTFVGGSIIDIWKL